MPSLTNRSESEKITCAVAAQESKSFRFVVLPEEHLLLEKVLLFLHVSKDKHALLGKTFFFPLKTCLA